MKKHDEGYVMLLVVVVILVMSIVSAALMSMTVTNLRNQRNSVDRMKEKYAAQGEMEKLVAQLEAGIPEEVTVEVTSLNLEETQCLKEAIAAGLTEAGLEDEEIGELKFSEDGKNFSCTIPLSAGTEKTQITCVLTLTGTAEKAEPADPILPAEEGEESDESTTEATASYKITFNALTYTSYEISEGGGEG